jgi:hypothetical protein
MATFKSVCYKDDALSSLVHFCRREHRGCTFLRSLQRFEIDDFKDFPVVSGLVPGVLENQVVKDPTLLERLYPIRPVKNNLATTELFRRLPEAHFGLGGIFTFVAKYWEHIFGLTISDEEATPREIYLRTFEIGQNASGMTEKLFVENAKQTYGILHSFVDPALHFLRIIHKLIGRWRSKQHRIDIARAEAEAKTLPFVRELLPGRSVQMSLWQVSSTSIITLNTPSMTSPMLVTEAFVFTKNDLERLDKLVRGLANVQLYFRTYSPLNPELMSNITRVANSYLTTLRSAFDSNRGTSANYVCRAFDVAHSLVQAHIANDISTRAITEQMDKIRVEGLDRIMNITSLVSLLKDLKPKEALEVSLIYKVIPQPDFDYFSIMAKQRELYRSTIHWGNTEENKEMADINEIILYFRWTLIDAFYHKHKRMPGTIKPTAAVEGWKIAYPHVKPHSVPFLECNDIDLTGAFVGKWRNLDVLDIVKDKAVCPEGINTIRDGYQMSKIGVRYKNQLCDVLLGDKKYSCADLRRSWTTINDSVKIDCKPEAKKPNPRMFMEAGTEMRLVHSEREDNIAQYAKHVVGCMSGLSMRDKIKAHNHVVAEDFVTEAKGLRKLLVSFDLAKFSPHFDVRIHDMMNMQFAEMFGQPDFLTAGDIFRRGDMHFLHKSVHHTMRKPGRDFEGFSGRANTIWHCAVMGYVVHKLRAMKLITGSARFAALIDDGLLRVNIDEKEYTTNIPRILSAIESIYRTACMKISWDKTYISEHFSVFLNDVRYYGESVKPGMRAYLKVTNQPEVPAASMVDYFAQIHATCRGARMAGSYDNTIWCLAVRLYIDTLKKFSGPGRTLPQSTPLQLFLPIAYGGCGAQTPVQFDATAASDPIIDGLSILKDAVRRWPRLKQAVKVLVDVPIREKTMVDRLRAPNTYRTTRRCLQSSRLAKRVEQKLSGYFSLETFRRFFSANRLYSVEAAISAMSGAKELSLAVVRMLWESTLECAMETIAQKLLKSTTAITLLGMPILLRVALSNYTEARSVISAWN